MDVVKIAKEALSYNPKTGVLTWKCRPESHFPDERASKIWNTKFAGKTAGCTKTHKNGKQYRYTALCHRDFMEHRVAWAIYHGELPVNQIDHIDGDGTNNSIANLRDVKAIENSRNMRLFKNNKSGIPGVGKHMQANRWTANIGCNGEIIYLGCFKDLFSACCARKSAEAKLKFTSGHGDLRPL